VSNYSQENLFITELSFLSQARNSPRQFFGGKPLTNKWKPGNPLPAQTPESVSMSKDLLKRGFSPTVCYAFMQTVGLVNDHMVNCFRYSEIRAMDKVRRE